MNKIQTANINNLIIEGIEDDYVFETIRKDNNFYEGRLLKKWLSYIKNSKVLLDIGANLGNHTLFWSQNMEYDKIYAFEPFLPNYERLKHNIENNHLKNIVSLNLGVGACKGYSKVLKFSEDNYSGTTLDTEIKANGDIQMIDIDSFVFEYELKNVDFIKIDTEGFEESVLFGMNQTLRQFHPDLWIEVTEQSFQNLIHTLDSLGYIIGDVEGFNILFLYKNRHTNIKQIELGEVLQQAFHNLDRVNQYYKNYETAKTWVSAKEQKIFNLNEQLEQSKAKYEKIKKQVSAKDAELLKLNKKLEEQILYYRQAQKKIVAIIREQDEQMQVMLQAKRIIQTNQREIRRLREENDMHMQRWNRVLGKWYGRAALKIYHRLRVANVLK